MKIILITLVLIICSYYFTKFTETEESKKKRIELTDDEVLSMDGFGTGWIIQFEDGYFLGKMKEGELVIYGNKTQFDYFAYKFHNKSKALRVAKDHKGAKILKYD